MNLRRLLVALCFALLCSGLLTWQIARHLPHSAPLPAMRNIVVAAKDLPAGEPVTDASVRLVSIPSSGAALPGMFSDAAALKGRALLVPVTSGEPLTSNELLAVGSPTGLSATIPSGMRLMILPASTLSTGTIGPVAPGLHVDVLVSFHSDTAGAAVSSMVVENVLTAGDPHKQGDAIDKVTAGDALQLLVTPEQAARLTVAGILGKLTIVIRNDADNEHNPGLSQVSLTGPQAPLKTSSLLKSATASVKPHTKEKIFSVEMLSGGKSATQTFAGDQP